MSKFFRYFSIFGLLAVLLAGVQIVLGGGGGGPTTLTFSSSGSVTIPISGTASTYPWVIPVSGVVGNITNITATLNGLSHTYPSDLEILLAGPGGQNTALMVNAGNGVDANSIALTFDDAAAGYVPAPVVSGTYKPTKVGSTTLTGIVDAGNVALSTFNGLNGSAVNGNWSLYVFDNYNEDAGSLSGWSITITSEIPVVPPKEEPETPVVSAPSTDNDSDGVANNVDNCISAYNPGQEDGWGSGMGDACDTDWYNDVGNGIAAFVQKNGNLNIHGNCEFLADGAPRCPEIAILDPSTFTPAQMPKDVTTANAGTWSVWVYYLHSNDGDVYQVNIYSTNPPQPDTLLDDHMEIHVHGGSYRWFNRGGDLRYGGMPDGVYTGDSNSQSSGDSKKG